MRRYYIFNVKEDILKLYKNSEDCLYLILKRIYEMKKEEINFGFNLFNQLLLEFDKEKLNNDIFIKLHKKYSYSKNKELHIINDLFKDEISTLIIHRTYMYIESTKNNTMFFMILKEYNINYFICDFERDDYFFFHNLLVYNKVF
ncbi:MAG: sporulation inhibitor of replication protein SirA [Bacilli bacterium]